VLSRFSQIVFAGIPRFELVFLLCSLLPFCASSLCSYQQPQHISYELLRLVNDQTNHLAQEPFAAQAKVLEKEGVHDLCFSIYNRCTRPVTTIELNFTKAQIPFFDAAYKKWLELRENSNTPYRDYAAWWTANKAADERFYFQDSSWPFLSAKDDIRLYCQDWEGARYAREQILSLDLNAEDYRQFQKLLRQSKTPFADYAAWWRLHKKIADITIDGTYGDLFSYDESSLPKIEQEWKSFGGNVSTVCKRVKELERGGPLVRYLFVAGLLLPVPETELFLLIQAASSLLQLLCVVSGASLLLSGIGNLCFLSRPCTRSSLVRGRLLAGSAALLLALAAPGLLDVLFFSIRDNSNSLVWETLVLDPGHPNYAEY